MGTLFRAWEILAVYILRSSLARAQNPKCLYTLMLCTKEKAEKTAEAKKKHAIKEANRAAAEERKVKAAEKQAEKERKAAERDTKRVRKAAKKEVEKSEESC